MKKTIIYRQLFSNRFIIGLLIIGFPLIAFAQTIPFDSPQWDVTAETFETGTYFGKKGVFIKDGGAYLKDAQFLNGIIEFDIAVTGERGFMGVQWRVVDRKNSEEFYIRPHLSGMPDANQYTPIINGSSAWQLYHGERYSAPVNYTFNEWMHIKIVVSGQQAEVYFMDMETPALFIPELKREAATGTLGITAGSGFAPAYFADFSYQSIEKPVLKSKPVAPEIAPDGVVKHWLVSEIVESEWLADTYQLNDNALKHLHWTRLNSEVTGITNLSRVQAYTREKNTVFCKLVIQSEKDQIKQLRFGYSDDVKVYVNGTLTYGGTNRYLSRDYRYLGTIGLFDELYLKLHKGENTILFAVSERFGGWGIIAAFADANNITLSE